MSTDGEGGIAGCRVPALAGLDELDLVRVQAAYGRPGQLVAWRAGRDVGGQDLHSHRTGDPCRWTMPGRAR